MVADNLKIATIEWYQQHSYWEMEALIHSQISYPLV
jgi:hypothetical protein